MWGTDDAAKTRWMQRADTVQAPPTPNSEAGTEPERGGKGKALQSLLAWHRARGNGSVFLPC